MATFTRLTSSSQTSLAYVKHAPCETHNVVFSALQWAQMFNEPEPRFMEFNYGKEYDLKQITVPTFFVSGNYQCMHALHCSSLWLCVVCNGTVVLPARGGNVCACTPALPSMWR